MDRLKPSILTVCLLAVCVLFVFPSVDAASTTTVYQVSSPASAIAGSESPLAVSATIYYNNTVSGYELVVGVLDSDLSPPRPVPGIVVSSTDPCINQPEAEAVCAMAITNSYGVERISFQLGGIFGGKREPGLWSLNVTSALVDNQNNLVPGSASSKLFTISLTSVALNVNVPSNVAVSVDGVPQPNGPVSVGVALGEHNITVPQIVNLTQSTRLRFDHWSDGNPSTIRTITITNSTSLQAYYVTQQLLTLIDVQGNATVSSWHDTDANATFATNQNVPFPGLLGVFGLRMSFQGWYENGQLVTNSPTGAIIMDEPHTLTALWQVDYSIPAAIILGIVAVFVITYLLVHRKRQSSRHRTSSKKQRRRRRP